MKCTQNLVFFITTLTLYRKASAINCYQCSGAADIECSDEMIRMPGAGRLEPTSCDHVFEAKYCIKSTSLDEGYSSKRYCSSVDLGNYCNYVRQPGDTLTYRSCVFTCATDGCNHSTLRKPNKVVASLLTMLSLLIVAGCF